MLMVAELTITGQKNFIFHLFSFAFMTNLCVNIGGDIIRLTDRS
jgi:hypothetical protein